LPYLKGGTVAKTVEELQSGYDHLVRQRENLLVETARVSEDLVKARGVVLSEIDAFARTRALSLRLAELAKERDALTLQIERGVQPQQAPA
jgi:hypothetical protein